MAQLRFSSLDSLGGGGGRSAARSEGAGHEDPLTLCGFLEWGRARVRDQWYPFGFPPLPRSSASPPRRPGEKLERSPRSMSSSTSQLTTRRKSNRPNVKHFASDVRVDRSQDGGFGDNRLLLEVAATVEIASRSVLVCQAWEIDADVEIGAHDRSPGTQGTYSCV